MYLYIPVEMCALAIRNKFIRPFQLYVYLKSTCSGKTKINRVELKTIATTLGLKSVRTVKNNLKLLLKSNWIGHSKTSGYYFIRGFDKVSKTYDFKCRTAARFNTDEILKFKAFITGAVIGKLVNVQRSKGWKTERKKSRSKQINRPFSSYFPVSNNAIANILKISVSTAFQLKKLASKADYIDVHKNLAPIPISLGHLNHFKKANEGIANKIIVRKGIPYIQQPDTVLPKIYFKKRGKKSKHI